MKIHMGTIVTVKGVRIPTMVCSMDPFMKGVIKTPDQFEILLEYHPGECCKRCERIFRRKAGKGAAK